MKTPRRPRPESMAVFPVPAEAVAPSVLVVVPLVAALVPPQVPPLSPPLVCDTPVLVNSYGRIDMKRYFLPMVLLSLACAPSPAPAMTPEERKAYLDNLLKILPPVKSFTDWQQKTGELPPDFDSLPRSNELPDPLKFLDGAPVKTPEDWAKRRQEIIRLLEKYDIGSMPPKPKIDSITPVDAAAAGAGGGPGGGGGFGGPGGAGGGGRGRGGPRGGPPGTAPGTAPATAPGAGAFAPSLDSNQLFFAAAPAAGAPAGPGATAPAAGPGAARGRGGPGGGFGGGGAPPAGSVTKIVDLKYGPNDQITTRVTLTIPAGAGPFPVMIAGSNAFVSRGYINCTFPGTTDAPPDIGKFYPDYDWGSMAKIAWTTQVVIDYLYTVPEVDKKHIATTGYSRDGKRALITAALDERITAVIPGSTGVGGIYAWRDGSERNGSESIESTTRSFPIWFTQRLRFFSGREDRLPVDGNLIMALLAPRSCLALWGDNDEVSQSWGMEHSVKSAATAYAFVGKPDAISIMHVPGYHGANDVTRSIDWLDLQFGRSQTKWTNDWTYPWNYDQWHAQVKSPVAVGPAAKSAIDGIATLADWQKKSTDINSAVLAMLGSNTPGTLEKPFLLPKLGDPSKPGAAGGRGGGGAPTLSDDIRAKARGNSYGMMPGATTPRKFSFTGADGSTIVADLYVANNAPANTKLPVVIWEHGYNYSLGYSWVYKSDMHPILALAQAGYAVLAYDQSGFGSRISEAAGFTISIRIGRRWAT